MKYIEKVISIHDEPVKEIEFNIDLVYIRTNIEENVQSRPEEKNIHEWTYSETQYTYPEYFEMQNKKIQEQDEQIAMTGDAVEFALLEIGRQSEEMANLQNPQPMKAKSLKATPMKASTLSIENNSNQGGTAMAGFLASRIMSAGNKSREEGKKAYEKFFKLRMYKPFQDETDAILIAEDCEDLIAVI